MPFIILDLFGVISSGSYKDTCSWVVNKYNLDYDQVYQVMYYKYFSNAALGKISEAEAFRLTAKELGLKETGAELRKIYLSFQTLNKPILEMAKSWQEQGVKIVIFSKNTPQQFNEVVRTFHLREYFPHIINSYNLGIEKKSVKALRYLLTKFKAKAKETLMIDDQAYNFVNADKMGMTTILYKNPGQLKKEVNSWLKGF